MHFFHFHADYVAICAADDHSGSHFHHRATAADPLCHPLQPLQRYRMALPSREDDHRQRRVTAEKLLQTIRLMDEPPQVLSRQRTVALGRLYRKSGLRERRRPPFQAACRCVRPIYIILYIDAPLSLSALCAFRRHTRSHRLLPEATRGGPGVWAAYFRRCANLPRYSMP